LNDRVPETITQPTYYGWNFRQLHVGLFRNRYTASLEGALSIYWLRNNRKWRCRWQLCCWPCGKGFKLWKYCNNWKPTGINRSYIPRTTFYLRSRKRSENNYLDFSFI